MTIPQPHEVVADLQTRLDNALGEWKHLGIPGSRRDYLDGYTDGIAQALGALRDTTTLHELKESDRRIVTRRQQEADDRRQVTQAMRQARR